jgi:hypothetical protein
MARGYGSWRWGDAKGSGLAGLILLPVFALFMFLTFFHDETVAFFQAIFGILLVGVAILAIAAALILFGNARGRW